MRLLSNYNYYNLSRNELRRTNYIKLAKILQEFQCFGVAVVGMAMAMLSRLDKRGISVCLR